MYTPLQKISLNKLKNEVVMFDANIFMIGVDRRITDSNYSFEKIKELILTPIFETFEQVIIHEKVYYELDQECRQFVDKYTGKNLTIVMEGNLYGVDPNYTTIFNEIAQHELVQYTRGRSKDQGEVYSLAYAAYHKINYFSSKEIMVDIVASDLDIL